MLTPANGAGLPAEARLRSAGPGRALLAAVLIVAGSLALGIGSGAVWAAAAPRVVYQVYTLSPPTAYAINPETSAFIAADGWYCFIALVGGAIIGLLGYLFAVRRYGPMPMVGVIAGSLAAAYTTTWLGRMLSGGPGFDHLLATSKPGTILHAPIELGAKGAIAFWPLAAAAVAGGLELVAVLRARHQIPEDGMPMPGMDTFGTRRWLAPPGADGRYQGRHGNTNGQSSMGRGQDEGGAPGGPDAQQGGSGRVGADPPAG